VGAYVKIPFESTTRNNEKLWKTTRVSKIQGEIEGIDQIDPKLLKLLKKDKVK
jgi:hypothetical protein